MNKDKKSRKKHRTRSRSASRSRSRSRSYSRSNSRDRRKKKSRRDVRSRSRSRRRDDNKKKITNESNVNLTSTRTKSSNFSYNPVEGATTMSQISTSHITTIQPLSTAAAKVDRKLYIGNIPTGITPSTLVKFLNTALLTLKANLQPGEPVLSAWISTDGHYAFVEFRTAEEANNGFLLNNISILGQPLKVGRPKTYAGAFSMSEDGSLCNTVFAALQAGTMTLPTSGRKVQFPTKILCFVNIVKEINIEDEDEYKNVVDDLREECGRTGNVLSVFMPRKDVEDNPSPGMGNAYVEFHNVEEAKLTRKTLVGRKYNNRFLYMIYFSEEKFSQNNFDLDDNNKSDENIEQNLDNKENLQQFNNF